MACGGIFLLVCIPLVSALHWAESGVLVQRSGTSRAPMEHTGFYMLLSKNLILFTFTVNVLIYCTSLYTP